MLSKADEKFASIRRRGDGTYAELRWVDRLPRCAGVAGNVQNPITL